MKNLSYNDITFIFSVIIFLYGLFIGAISLIIQDNVSFLTGFLFILIVYLILFLIVSLLRWCLKKCAKYF